MPTMVLTRWNSWYRVIEYLAEFLPLIKSFLLKEKREQENSELVNAVLEILNDPTRFSETQLVVQFIYERARVFYEIIEEFEKPQGITHQAYNKIMNLYNHLRFTKYSDELGEIMDRIIEDNELNGSYWQFEFKKLYGEALIKLESLIKEHEM